MFLLNHHAPTSLHVMSAVANIGNFTARNIANVLWAFAKMTHNPGPAFLDSLGAEAGRKVTDFNAQNLANTIWAFGTLGKSNHGYSQLHMCMLVLQCTVLGV